jgi:SNF2 family DNA or RNA helicase
VIRKAAIDAFLSRKLTSFDWLKQLTDAELDDDGPNEFKLWRHQRVALIILEELKRFMLHLDMGAGKTLITLALIQRRKDRGENPRAIVFVPYVASVETWVEECAKHTPRLKCVPLTGNSMDNSYALTQTGDVFVICYQSALAMVVNKIPKKWKLTARDVRERFASFDTLVCDEVHRCKNVASLTYRMCRAIATRSPWCIGLTGTPFGNDLQDLWAQFYLVDFGETLGDTLNFYRAVFFTCKSAYWGGVDYQFKKKLMPDLKRLIKHKSLHYGIDEFADMPSKEYVIRRLRAPEVSQSYVQAAIKQINEGARRKDYHLVKSSYMQLRQLSSGFMTLKGEDESRVQVKFDENPKLDALAEIVEGLPAERKAIIFHHFVYSNQLISDRLKAMKMPHARVWGGQRDSIAEMRRFKADPSCRVLVINSKMGSSTFNLQIANFVIFFEQPDSPIDRQQAERRTWRPGQTRRVVYYDLLVHGTADDKMRKSNKSGENLLQALLRGGVEL